MKWNELKSQLWFDVGIKRYTTVVLSMAVIGQLWFDVGIKRYTTIFVLLVTASSCGLM